ncbi:hypothetical protein [Pseudoxanthomonas sp.]|jgi:hypothetical protein|uniref:hypothetical protein n=1 Tax=Pseudoxanthomonas sp. TaxID=1871049 RepID=UPI003F8148D7
MFTLVDRQMPSIAEWLLGQREAGAATCAARVHAMLMFMKVTADRACCRVAAP